MDDDFLISLAWAQKKVAFLWWGDQWMKPRGATQTTHNFNSLLGLVGGQRADLAITVGNESFLSSPVTRFFGSPLWMHVSPHSASSGYLTSSNYSIWCSCRWMLLAPDGQAKSLSIQFLAGGSDSPSRLPWPCQARTGTTTCETSIGARTTVQAELPKSFSQIVADKVLGGL
jgi:hypothetical protein